VSRVRCRSAHITPTSGLQIKQADEIIEAETSPLCDVHFFRNGSRGDLVSTATALKSGLVRSGPVWSGPVWSGPVRSGPVRSGLVRSGPVRGWYSGIARDFSTLRNVQTVCGVHPVAYLDSTIYGLFIGAKAAEA